MGNQLSRRSLLGAAGLAVTAVGADALLSNASSDASSPAAPDGVTSAEMIDPHTPSGARPAAGGYGQRLIFSDEFDGTALNTHKWTARDEPHDNGTWWYKPENVRLNGRGGLALALGKNAAGDYTFSRIDSKGNFDFTFGTIEYRMHVPPTIGHLAAAWMMPTNGTSPGGVINGNARDGAEIDIAETFSADDKYAITLHWDGYGKDHQMSQQVVKAPGLHQQWWHTFTLNWWSNRMVFSYDGQPVRRITDPPDGKLISQVKSYPIASNEMHKGWCDGDIHHAPLNWESAVLVDYIRVWR